MKAVESAVNMMLAVIRGQAVFFAVKCEFGVRYTICIPADYAAEKIFITYIPLSWQMRGFDSLLESLL